MIAGAIAASAFDGTVSNLRGRPVGGGARFGFRHRGIVEEQRFRYLVTVDGDLTGILRDGEFSGRLDAMIPGEHRLEVWPIREDVRRFPDLHGHAYGKRAYLQWTPVPEEDARGYVIFTDAGSGTINYTTPAATVSTIAVFPIWSALPSSGTGSGLLTAGGGWTGDATNETFTVQVTGSGTCRHDVSGSWSADLPFLQGVPVFLPRGIVIVFESGSEAYDAGDEWEIRVGPRAWWSSGILAEGTHKFAIKARDAAGNLSAATTERSIAIIYRPGEVTAATISLGGGMIQLAWTLPEDDDLDAVLIYANFSNLFQRLQEDIIEEEPWQVLDVDVTDFSFEPPVPGVWRFYIRTRDTAGRISESVTMLEFDTTAVPASVRLNVPEQVTVTPAAGGTFVLGWVYPINGGLEAASFRIYRNTNPSAPVFVTPHATVSWEAAGRAAGGVIPVQTTLGPEASTVYYTVRAFGGGYETTNTDLHQAVPDATAPSTPATLTGVPN